MYSSFSFKVRDGGSRQIQVLQMLTGIEVDLVEEALRQSQMEEDEPVFNIN